MISFTITFHPYNCYSNKYLYNDVRIIWTTMKRLHSYFHVWFFTRKYHETNSNLVEKFFFISLVPKKATRLRFMSLLSIRKLYLPQKKSHEIFYLCCFSLSRQCWGWKISFHWKHCRTFARKNFLFIIFFRDFSPLFSEESLEISEREKWDKKTRLTATFHYFPRFSQEIFIGKHLCKLRQKRGWICWKMLSWKTLSVSLKLTLSKFRCPEKCSPTASQNPIRSV